MREALQAERSIAADSDGDGELSRAERRAARDTQRDSMEAQLDVDGDGTVSDAEAAGFDEVRKEMRGKGGGGEGHGKGHGNDHNHGRGDGDGRHGGERGNASDDDTTV